MTEANKGKIDPKEFMDSIIDDTKKDKVARIAVTATKLYRTIPVSEGNWQVQHIQSGTIVAHRIPSGQDAQEFLEHLDEKGRYCSDEDGEPLTDPGDNGGRYVINRVDCDGDSIYFDWAELPFGHIAIHAVIHSETECYVEDFAYRIASVFGLGTPSPVAAAEEMIKHALREFRCKGWIPDTSLDHLVQDIATRVYRLTADGRPNESPA